MGVFERALNMLQDRVSHGSAAPIVAAMAVAYFFIFWPKKKGEGNSYFLQGKKLTLYGDPVSTCTRKCIQILEEKNATWELKRISLREKEQKNPEYMKKHPFGKVPVLETSDGFILYESKAIVRFLNQALPGPNFIPSDAQENAEMERWISVHDSYFAPPQKRIRFERFLKKRYNRGECDESVVAAALAELEPALDTLEARLGRAPYLAGAAFSLADLLAGPDFAALLQEEDAAARVRARPRLAAW
eukprot:CAMPEP_0194585288 /NCGR_PEP_ID=MMETSP0292-20121207/17669_1 /TAXON_ID=39354 /ORGANISM="Heterosigma akashiwo, Strain CCMP2393" /LENGTH=245 /DNA_ID=CAMNT_0039440719 /DNA_START=32 /DNA_END=766 /DNA_ORIENTATION=-